MNSPPLPGVFGALAPGARARRDHSPRRGVASAGELNVVVLGLLALLAAVAGDNAGFAIGHFGGRPLVSDGAATSSSPPHAWIPRRGSFAATAARWSPSPVSSRDCARSTASLPACPRWYGCGSSPPTCSAPPCRRPRARLPHAAGLPTPQEHCDRPTKLAQLQATH